MSNDASATKGCLLLIAMPFIVVYGYLMCLYDAYTLHKIWVWHFSKLAEPWSVTLIFVGLVALGVVRNKTSAIEDEEKTKKTGADLLAAYLSPMIVRPLIPTLALLVAWWAT